MNYKKLMENYFCLLFNLVVLLVLCVYVYCNHYPNYIMLFGITSSTMSVVNLIRLILITYKENKKKPPQSD